MDRDDDVECRWKTLRSERIEGRVDDDEEGGLEVEVGWFERECECVWDEGDWRSGRREVGGLAMAERGGGRGSEGGGRRRERVGARSAQSGEHCGVE